MKNNRTLAKIGRALAVVVAVLGTSAHAETQVYAQAGAFYSDNVGRLATGEQGELNTELGAGLVTDYSSNALDLDLNASVTYLNYGGNLFDDETLAEISGVALFTFVPDRLTWEVSEYYGQRAVDPFKADRPGNREPFSVFSTGPNIVLFSRGRNTINAQGRYRNVKIDQSIVDYQTFRGGLAWQRALPGSRSIGLGIDTERFEFDSRAAGSDYDVQRAYLKFASQTSVSTLDLLIGGNQLHDMFESESSFYSTVKFSRDLGAGTTLDFEASRGYADSGQSFANRQEQELLPREADDIFDSSDPFISTTFLIGVSKEASDGATTAVVLRWEDSEYETQSQFDRDFFSLEASHDRAIASNLRANFSARIDRREFLLQSDDGYVFEFGLIRDLSKSLDVEILLGHYDRDSDPSFTSYTENRAGLRFTARR